MRSFDLSNGLSRTNCQLLKESAGETPRDRGDFCVSGLAIGDDQVVTVGTIWINGDFLSGQSLPGMLPPPTGYQRAFLNFGLVNVNTPTIFEGFSVGGLIVKPMPLYAAAWLFASSLYGPLPGLQAH